MSCFVLFKNKLNPNKTTKHIDFNYCIFSIALLSFPSACKMFLILKQANPFISLGFFFFFFNGSTYCAGRSLYREEERVISTEEKVNAACIIF